MRQLTVSIISIFLAVCFCLICNGCGGTRQTSTEKQSFIEVKNEYQEGVKVVLGNTFTYTPFDGLKPMKIDGKVYENAIVSNDQSKTITKWKGYNITKTIVIEKTKQTEKSDNTILWIFIALIVCLFVFLWFYLPKMGKIPF